MPFMFPSSLSLHLKKNSHPPFRRHEFSHCRADEAKDDGDLQPSKKGPSGRRGLDLEEKPGPGFRADPDYSWDAYLQS